MLKIICYILNSFNNKINYKNILNKKMIKYYVKNQRVSTN
jgi:hypothetical protein